MKTKNYFLLVVALCCATATRAQNEVIGAVLQTGDNVTMYYGVNALKDAYGAAAETGSVITLTAGTFNSPGNITKSVSIYGVGFENNQVTTINGSLTIRSSSEETMLDGVRIEGITLSYTIYVQRVKNLVVSNSKFASSSSYFRVDGDNVQNVTVKQCYIIGDITGTAKVDGLLFQNCYITGQNKYDNAEGRIQIDHCILTKDVTHYRALYTNNIINSSNRVAEGSTARNNIFLNIASLNTSVLSEGNWFRPTLSDLFTDGTDLTYSANRTFTLSSPEFYVGTDGTPVGINGAGHTWKNRASTPIINSLTLGVSGSTINVTYDAETRNP